MPYSYGIAQGIDDAGEGLAEGIKASGERGRKRRAAMKLGETLSDENVLSQFGDPASRAAVGSIAKGLQSGDLFVDEAAQMLKIFPEKHVLPPEIAEMIRHQNGQGGSAAGTAQGGEPPVPSDVGAEPPVPSAYLKSYSQDGVNIEFPEPASVTNRNRRQKIQDKQAESEIPSADTVSAGKAATAALNELESFLKVDPKTGIPQDVSSVPMGTTSDIQLNASGRMFRSRYETLVSALALLRTGKAGEQKQEEAIRKQYKIGKGEKANPKLMADRLQQMRKEINARLGKKTGPNIKSITEIKD